MSEPVELLFTLNGEDVTVLADAAGPVLVAQHRALVISRNTGRVNADWELRNERGFYIDEDTGCGQLAAVRMFLTLRIGAGGSRWGEEMKP